MTTPPPGNMGPMAEPWRRWAEDQVLANTRAIESLGGDTTNDGRANNAQMDTFASQINELYQRQSSLTLDDGFGTTALPPNSSQNVTKNIQLPRPSDATRNGWISITFNCSQSNGTDFSSVFISLYCDGMLFHRNSVAFPIGASTPANWRGMANITAYTGYVASPASGGLVTIDMTANTNNSGSARSFSVSDIRITNQYSQKVV